MGGGDRDGWVGWFLFGRLVNWSFGLRNDGRGCVLGGEVGKMDMWWMMFDCFGFLLMGVWTVMIMSHQLWSLLPLLLYV